MYLGLAPILVIQACDAPIAPADATLPRADASADGATDSEVFALDDVPNVPPGVPPPDATVTLDGPRD